MASEPQQDHVEDPKLDDETSQTMDEPTNSVEALRQELEDAVAAKQRAMADFSNFQRRASENESRARSQGIAEVARTLVPVLDQFEMALGQAANEVNIDSLIEGITLVKDGFLQALERNGVHPISPEVNDEFDPMRHEAMMKQPVEGVAPGHVSMVVQSGWELGSVVLRPAQVALAPSAEEAGNSEPS